MTRRSRWLGAAGLALIVALAVVAWGRYAPAAAAQVPTGRVQKGPVQVKVYTTGSLLSPQMQTEGQYV